MDPVDAADKWKAQCLQINPTAKHVSPSGGDCKPGRKNCNTGDKEWSVHCLTCFHFSALCNKISFRPQQPVHLKKTTINECAKVVLTHGKQLPLITYGSLRV